MFIDRTIRDDVRVGSTPLDQLLRQLKPGWKNVQWAKATGLNATHLSRVRTGRVNLSMHVAQQLASAVVNGRRAAGGVGSSLGGRHRSHCPCARRNIV